MYVEGTENHTHVSSLSYRKCGLKKKDFVWHDASVSGQITGKQNQIWGKCNEVK
jgi:hypothetical protein